MCDTVVYMVTYYTVKCFSHYFFTSCSVVFWVPKPPECIDYMCTLTNAAGITDYVNFMYSMCVYIILHHCVGYI